MGLFAITSPPAPKVTKKSGAPFFVKIIVGGGKGIWEGKLQEFDTSTPWQQDGTFCKQKCQRTGDEMVMRNSNT